VRDAFSIPREELAHRVRSYNNNNIRARQSVGRALPAAFPTPCEQKLAGSARHTSPRGVIA
jgi:hypothetical protein